MKKLEFNDGRKKRAKILGKAKKRRLKSYCFMLILFCYDFLTKIDPKLILITIRINSHYFALITYHKR
jgi:hypothetical protein